MAKQPEKPTPAERHAAGALGRQAPAKPAGVSTAQWHADRFNARGGRPEDEVEAEPEEKPLPEWAQKQMRTARNYRAFLAQELAKGGSGPDAA